MTKGTTTKVAVIISGDPAPRWQVEALEQLGELRNVEVSTIVAVPPPERRSTLATALRDRWVKRQPDLETTRPTALPATLQRLVMRTNDPHAQVASLSADVIICLAPQIVRSARNGQEVWRIVGNTVEPCADEVLDRSHVACLALVRHDDKVLMQGCLQAMASTHTASSERLLKAAATWPARVLFEWGRSGGPEPATDIGTAPKAKPSAGNLAVLRFLFSNPFQRTERQHAVANGEEWNIGVLYQPISTLLSDGNSVNVRWLPAPAEGSQRMEPFGYMDQEDRLTALYVKLDGRDGKWSIARVRPKGDNVLKRSRLLMALGQGSGYPFVVRGQEGPLVVFGSHEDRATALYRFDGTGEALEPFRVILERTLCSPTMFQHNGKWWLMGTSPEQPDAELLAFHAEHLEGPFIPHQCMPLKLDLRSARPAGTPFVVDGQLYRPAIDATVPGQPRIVIQAIDELSPERFVEHTFRQVPLYHGTAYPHGTRTLCAMGDVTLVDGLRLSGNKAPQKPSLKRQRSSRKKRS
ncbi:MAG: hypothetical protein JNL52_11240 [Flavobacteriales bacterium]|nr:hypothetical protein [Flavobacteriales bacterium]